MKMELIKMLAGEKQDAGVTNEVIVYITFPLLKTPADQNVISFCLDWLYIVRWETNAPNRMNERNATL